MKYKIEYLPIVLEDLKGIVLYISDKLKNPQAAQKIAESIVSKVESLSAFPYSLPVYTPIKPLTHEYRKFLVKNYFVFYSVDEKSKTVTIFRIIYARRNIDKVL